ncbi:MAG: Rho termination factor N-terminal domain-containing protein [Clostridia bacterium]
MLNFDKLTLTELKELAKENNIKNISKLKKDELITVLKQILGDSTNTEKKEKKKLIMTKMETLSWTTN